MMRGQRGQQKGKTQGSSKCVCVYMFVCVDMKINECSWKEESYETSPHQWVMAGFSQGEMNTTSLSELHLGPHPLTDETYSTQDPI